MKQNELIERFFKPLQPIEENKIDITYAHLEYVKLLLDRSNDILQHNSYIIDYNKKKFFYIAEQSIFLCGYSRDEVLEMGYDFYKKILSKEDLDKLVEINEVGFSLYYDMPTEKRQDVSISYDLLLHRKDGKTFCVNHKLTPFLFTADGNILMSICCIRLSANNKTGNVIVFFRSKNERLSYSFNTKQWELLSTINLSDIERYIILETDRGTLEKQQANYLNCTRSNIRYYKKQIMKKTNTKTMREAIIFLFSNGLI